MGRRVLFVDDERHVLEQLAGDVSATSPNVDATFVQGGAAAQAYLADHDVDAIVADLDMPGIDGATLLHEVHDASPQVVRIIVSGETAAAQRLESLQVAHQAVVKPVNARTLLGKIEQTCLLRDTLREPRLQEIVGGTEALPAAPGTYLQITQAMADPDVPVEKIAMLVSGDVGIAAKLLQVVNSAFFALSREIIRVSDAVAYLGLDATRAVVLATEVARSFGDVAPGFGFDRFEAHAREVAGGAMALVPDDGRNEAFMAGLLHDVGELLVTRYDHELWSDVVARSRSETQDRLRYERDRLGGVTHAEVGGALLGMWGLPYSVVDAVTHHHQPVRSGELTFDVVGAVHVVEALVAWRDEGKPEPGPTLDLAYLDRVGMSGKVAEWAKLVLGVELY